jgi:hypothetical protein
MNMQASQSRYPAGLEPVILVGICSGRKFRDRREAVRDTWLKNVRGNVVAKFFVGQGTEALEREDDTWVVDAPDDYPSLPRKVAAFYKRALGMDFDYLFKCDDDTYLDPARLAGLIEPGTEFMCSADWHSFGWAHGGAGYLSSRRVVRALASAEFPAEGCEDVLVSRHIQKWQLPVKPTAELCSRHETVPLADNARVTAHWCAPETLRTIHAVRQSVLSRTFAATHPHWKGLLHFFQNGHFLGGGKKPHGKWSESGDGILLLEWDHWPRETLVRCGNGYRSADGFTLSPAF